MRRLFFKPTQKRNTPKREPVPRPALSAVFLTVVLSSSFSLKAEDRYGPSSRASESLAKDDDPAIAKPAQKPREPTGPVADTVLSPLGGYGTAPPPDTGPYDVPDFAPITELNQHLPRWIQFGLEERFRWEMPSGSGFQPHNDDSYLLNRLRFGMSIQPTSWLRVVAQLQDARPMFLKPPMGPPHEVKWDLKQAYVKLGASETSPSCRT